ncbi:MAG: MaoC family dehydratase [Chloroflexi bacterium]|nr:MaoC family dehydratase [Chloroflexota bacterium]MDA1239268.1 MaoC family dehydratase [Chloroflexota bacterium]
MADDVQGLTVGSVATFSKAVTQEDIDLFARVTGDTNPLHSDAAYAARTRFKAPIAHGMFGAGVISAALGTKLAPQSVVIYMAQNLQFRGPVKAGDTITATVTVTKVDAERSRLSLDTIVTNQDAAEVIRGDAMVMVEALG